MVPIVIVLICIGWRLLLRKKREEKEDSEFMTIKTRPIDPDESLKAEEESLQYRKNDLESPEPVKVADSMDDNPNPNFPYGQSYDQTQMLPPVPEDDQTKSRWAGETEIN